MKKDSDMLCEELQIHEALRADTAVLANIVRASFQDVAELVNVTPETCPTFPAFCQPDWIQTEMDKGTRFFFAFEQGRRVGCVGMTEPAGDECKLVRLAVMPTHRHQGLGRMLVDYILTQARQMGLRRVNLHTAASLLRLRKWYESIGFVLTHKKQFEHIPFDVAYMKYELE